MKKYIAKNKCLSCGKEIVCKKYQVDIRKFCSNKCHIKYRVDNFLGNKEKNSFWGKKHTDKTKKLLSELRKGKKLSKETIDKIKIANSNDKCYAWKGGSNDWWKKRVKERDDYTCQLCGLKEPLIMEAHHIKSKTLYPSLKYSLSNGITLCPNCHKRLTINDKELKLWKKTNSKRIKRHLA